MKISIVILTFTLILHMLDCTYAIQFLLNRYEIDRSINETGRYLGRLSNGQPFLCHYARQSGGQSTQCIKQNKDSLDEFEKENIYPFFFPNFGVPPRCPSLMKFNNGNWICQDDLKYDAVTVYTSCYPACNRNFTLETDFQVRCTEFREWDKDLEPHCISTNSDDTGIPTNAVVTTTTSSTQFPVSPDIVTDSATFSKSTQSMTGTPLRTLTPVHTSTPVLTLTTVLTSTSVRTSLTVTNISHPRQFDNDDSDDDDDMDTVIYIFGAIIGVLGILTIVLTCYFCRRTNSPQCCLSCKNRSYDPEINPSYTKSDTDINLCEAKSPLIQNEDPCKKLADPLEDQTNNNEEDIQTGRTTVVHCSSEKQCNCCSGGRHQLPAEVYQNGIGGLGHPGNRGMEASLSDNNKVPSSEETLETNNLDKDVTGPETDIMEDHMWENIKKGPESCDCTVNDAINDITRIEDSVLFVEQLGVLIDVDFYYGDKRSWVGLATFLLPLTHNNILKLRQETKKYLEALLTDFKCYGIKLGHILEYFTRKESLRVDVVQHFEKHHRNCVYCDSLYMCIKRKQLQRLHSYSFTGINRNQLKKLHR